ncbi:MAG: tellurium resistance protein [Rhodobacteraceae bacterium]|nr:tellurium resistance protein [Paracoccaceae bacterium]
MAFKAPKPTPGGLWRRVPPAIFPSIMGFLGLGIAWRRAVAAYPVPAGIGEALLGAGVILFAFAAIAYGSKIARRPAVLAEELRILPGRAGVSAMVLCIYLSSIALFPYSPDAALWLLWAGFAVHGAFLCVLFYVFATGPAEQRRVNPVWHLNFVGFIIGALSAYSFEFYSLTLVIFALTAIMAAAIWSVSVDQIIRADVPAPLRPLLAIHLAPVALLGLVGNALGLNVLATGCAGVAALLMLWYLGRGFWLTEAGFSALWGAFTFPLAATASLWLTLGGIWRIPGGIALIAASLIVPAILYRILKLWAGGQLALKTNAAIA